MWSQMALVDAVLVFLELLLASEFLLLALLLGTGIVLSARTTIHRHLLSGDAIDLEDRSPSPRGSGIRRCRTVKARVGVESALPASLVHQSHSHTVQLLSIDRAVFWKLMKMEITFKTSSFRNPF